MFGIGMPEMLVLLVVALIVFGPKKLPELAKSMGRALGEFKRATSDIKDSIEEQTGLNEVRDSLNEVKQDIADQVNLDDAAASSAKKEEPAKGTEPDQAPLSQVKEAFDTLNADSDTKVDSEAPADHDNDPRKNSTP